MKTRSKPPHYPTVPFHTIRIISFISATIVSGILIFFCLQLKKDGYKLPWTLLVVLIASLANLLALILTLLIHCCGTLSPLFNLIINVPLLILWVVGAGLLSWNLYGTLAHSCSKSTWASDDGVMICQIYKTLFSFMIIGTISHVAQLVLDVRARRQQTRLGAYGKMDDTKDMKLETYSTASVADGGDAAAAVANRGPHPSVHDLPYGGEHPSFRDESSAHGAHWRPQPRGNHNGDHSPNNVRMDDFTYQAPAQQTTYDSGNYMYNDRRY